MDILGYITYFWLWNPKMAISECGKLFDPRRLHDPESPVWSSATPRHTNPGARFWQLTGADSLGSSWHVLQDYTPSRSRRNHGLGLLLFKQYNPFTSCFQPYHKMLITRSFCFWVWNGRFLCLYYNLSWSQPHLSIPFLVSLLASASLLAKSSFLLNKIHHFRRNLQVFSGFMVKNVQAPSFWPLPPAAFWGQPKAADGCFKGLATVVAFRLASWPSKFIQVLDPKFWALPHFPSILSHPLPHQTIPAKPSFHQWPSWHSRRCPTS